MSKLFTDDDNSLDDVPLGRITRVGEEISLASIDLSPVIEDHNDYMELATEHLTDLSYKMELARTIKTSFSSSDVGSKEYLYGLESYSEVLKGLAGNLGTTIHVASLEDFTSRYSVNASHEVAMEGIKSFFKKIWEKIRDFFKSFFKKIGQFIKRITGGNLDLEMYEKYVSDIMRQIRKEKKVCSDPKVRLGTKLSVMVCDVGTMEPSPEDLIRDSKIVVANLKRVIVGTLRPAMEQFSSGPVKEISEVISRIEGYTNSTINLPTVLDDINAVSLVLNKIFNSITTRPALTNSLPSDVYEKLISLVSVTGSTSCRSLVDTTVGRDRLPKNFNIFTICSDVIANQTVIGADDNYDDLRQHLAVGISSNDQDSMSISSTAFVVSSLPQLEELYEIYKDTAKVYTEVDKMVKLVDGVEKSINKDLNLMSGRITNKINDLKAVNIDITDSIENAVNILSKVLSYSTEEERKVSVEGNLVKSFKTGIASIGGTAVTELVKLIETVLTKTLKSNMDSYDTDTVTKAFGVSGVNIEFNKLLKNSNITKDDVPNIKYSEGVSEEEMIKLSQALSLLETSLNRAFISFQQVVKTTCGDVFANYTETRHAMIKYLYDSARTYR